MRVNAVVGASARDRRHAAVSSLEPSMRAWMGDGSIVVPAGVRGGRQTTLSLDAPTHALTSEDVVVVGLAAIVDRDDVHSDRRARGARRARCTGMEAGATFVRVAALPGLVPPGARWYDQHDLHAEHPDVKSDDHC
jgi:hypothetical protein